MTLRIQTLEFVTDFPSVNPWQAWVADDDSETCPIGVGATEQEAIDDLMAQLEDRP
jgi:hypothetical protein